uniref:Uncharacterized protein n=1 Tax=Rhizophora mucronata TaxID=61149 RepID=A0A2P2Q305_RHIMU
MVLFLLYSKIQPVNTFFILFFFTSISTSQSLVVTATLHWK